MKYLRKKLKKKTVEAYACAHCGTPDDCIAMCAGDIALLNYGAAYSAQSMNNRV
jgi:hypothetical protein